MAIEAELFREITDEEVDAYEPWVRQALKAAHQLHGPVVLETPLVLDSRYRRQRQDDLVEALAHIAGLSVRDFARLVREIVPEVH
jgi:hypothetical protein